MSQPRTALIGVPLAMSQNVIYALPVRYPFGIFVSPPSVTIEVADENDAGEFEATTIDAAGQIYTSAAFIRCTSDDCTLICKAL